MSNKSENKRFNDAASSENLSKDEKRRMHEDLQSDPNKDGKSYKELKEIAKEYKSSGK